MSSISTSAVIYNIGDERATAIRYPMRLTCNVWFTTSTSQWVQLSATQHKHILCARRS